MNFEEIKSPVPNAHAYRRLELRILIEEHDNITHLSISHPDRIPSWGELKQTKYHFFPNLSMVMYFPPIKDYVNVHPYCLHLYSEDQ